MKGTGGRLFPVGTGNSNWPSHGIETPHRSLLHHIHLSIRNIRHVQYLQTLQHEVMRPVNCCMSSYSIAHARVVPISIHLMIKSISMGKLVPGAQSLRRTVPSSLRSIVLSLHCSMQGTSSMTCRKWYSAHISIYIPPDSILQFKRLTVLISLLHFRKHVVECDCHRATLSTLT